VKEGERETYDLWDIIKQTNVHTIENPKDKEKEKSNAPSVLSLCRETDIQI
jgi:hypothetical protein